VPLWCRLRWAEGLCSRYGVEKGASQKGRQPDKRLYCRSSPEDDGYAR